MKKRVISSILVLVLLSVIFAGCTSEKPSDTGNAKTPAPTSSDSSNDDNNDDLPEVYPIEGDPVISYAVGVSQHVTAVSEWEDTPFFKAWQEQTGINLELIEIADVTIEIVHMPDFSLLVASGDYPDIISANWNSYSGGAAKAIEDEIVIPIDDYIEKFAPDYLKELESNEEWMKSVKTPKGNFTGFYQLRTAPALNSFGMIIRKDWLDQLNLSVPTTTDEFYNTLTAFKNEMDATAPLSLPIGNLRDMGRFGLITSPFDLVSTGYYHVDGTVHYGAYESQYKDVLTWLNKLYSDGLLDNNVLTLDGATSSSNIMNDISGITTGYASGGMGNWLTTMKDVNPDYALAGVGSLIKTSGEKAYFGQRQDSISVLSAITSNCDDIETAVKFLNYGYTEPGNLLMYYGIEGESFEFIDGYPYYTDFVKNHPDGLSFAQALSQYDYSPANGPFVANGDYSAQTYNDAQLDALNVWRNNDVMDHYIPSMMIDAADVDEYASITSEVFTYESEQFALFVTGERSLDEFDDYISVLESMGIKRMIEIYQNAFDVFNQ